MSHRAESDTLRVGDPAPPFTLLSQKAVPWSLQAALANGPVLLAFHRGTW